MDYYCLNVNYKLAVFAFYRNSMIQIAARNLFVVRKEILRSITMYWSYNSRHVINVIIYGRNKQKRTFSEANQYLYTKQALTHLAMYV